MCDAIGAIESTYLTSGHRLDGRNWERESGTLTVTVQDSNNTGMQSILSDRQVKESERSPWAGRSISKM